MTHVLRVRTGVRYELVPEHGAFRWKAFVEVHDSLGGIKTYDEERVTYDTEEEAMRRARELGRTVTAKMQARGSTVVNRTPPSPHEK